MILAGTTSVSNLIQTPFAIIIKIREEPKSGTFSLADAINVIKISVIQSSYIQVVRMLFYVNLTLGLR